MGNGSKLNVHGSPDRVVLVEGDYKEIHNDGDAPPAARAPLPEGLVSLAAWIDRSKQVQEIEGYFRERYAKAKRNGPVLFLLPSRSGDYGDLFIRRCAREIVPKLIGDGETANLALAELQWPPWLNEPADLLLKFAQSQDFKDCACAEDVVLHIGAAPANHYLVIEIDGRGDDRPVPHKVMETVWFLADRLPEITPRSRLIVLLHIVCTDYHTGPSSARWGLWRLRRCRTCDMVTKLKNACAGHERIVILSPLDLVGYADYERWAEDLRRNRANQLYYPEIRDGWKDVFDKKMDQRCRLGEIHDKLRGVLEKAHRRAAQAA